jgi:hypothetical protein
MHRRERKKRMKRNIISVMVGTVLGFALVTFALNHKAPTQVIVEAKTTTEQETTAAVEEATVGTVAETVEQTTEEPTTAVQLYDVPLDADLQLYIMDLCRGANISAALVMAIIERESNFNASAKGDSGNSLGLMQIQPRWHQWRMDALGGSDWLNPYDNVAVGVHILTGLFEKYGDDVYMVLMAYNGGSSYANRMASQGIMSEYARKVEARATELERGNE